VGLMFAGTVALLGAIFCAFVAKLLLSEFEAWSPHVIEWLIDRAVGRLPREHQERLSEEWRAFIHDTPGQVMKVLRAFGLTRGANAICLGTANYTWTERAFSRLFGAQVVVLFGPLVIVLFLFAFFVHSWAQSSSPLLCRREFRGRQVAYRIRLGNDRASHFLRTARIDRMPFMYWAMLRGIYVVTWPQWRRVWAGIAAGLADDASAVVRKLMRGRH
jgi:hypothetical protein